LAENSLWKSVTNTLESATDLHSSSMPKTRADSFGNPSLEGKASVTDFAHFSTEMGLNHTDPVDPEIVQECAVQQLGSSTSLSDFHSSLGHDVPAPRIGFPATSASDYAGSSEGASKTLRTPTKDEIPSLPFRVTGYGNPNMNREIVDSLESLLPELVPSSMFDDLIRNNRFATQTHRTDLLANRSPTLKHDLSDLDTGLVPDLPYHQNTPLLSGDLKENVTSPRVNDLSSDFSSTWINTPIANPSSSSSFNSASSDSKIFDGSLSNDLTKTNELLIQLIDEIRKGRQSYLPVRLGIDASY
jgi:hypothetical protein